MDALKDVQDKASKTIGDGIVSATEAVKAGANTARETADKAYERAQEFLDTGKAHASYADSVIIEKLRVAAKYARDHQEASLAVLGGATVLAIPSTRRLLWRLTIGQFRSEEAMFKSAEAKLGNLATTVDAQAAEASKLEQRAALAVEEWQSGLRKTLAAHRQLRSLAGQVRSTEKTAASLVSDLRRLPSKPAQELRTEAANKLAAAKRQRKALEKRVYKLESQL